MRFRTDWRVGRIYNPRMTAEPIHYSPALEVPEDGEAETLAGLMEALRGIADTTFKDSGHAIRSVHAKSHGLLRAELRVAEGLPPLLAHGIFAQPGSWPVLMRFSSTPGDILDDSVSTPRGLAVKVVGVQGERLPGSEGAVTQDFVLINGDTFATPGPKKFLGSLKLLAVTTDKVPNLKKALSAVLRGAEKVVEAFGGESGVLKGLGGHPYTHPLGETYFSQVPILFGPYMVKLSIAPIAPALLALTDAPLAINGHPNGLRDAVVDYFASQRAEWEIRVQFCTDLAAMPIEDASVTWPQEQSAYIAVARLVAEPQAAWSAARAAAVDEGMGFSPWHGIAAHRPIGAVMRVRKAAYEMSIRQREAHSGHVVAEPQNLNDLPA